MIFTKDYISNIENLNVADPLNSKLRGLLVEKIEKGFEEIFAKNTDDGGSLETLFIESLKAFNNYDIDICFTHLEFLIWHCEENNINKFESTEFNNQVLSFYEYIRSLDKISFFHISRVITLISDYSIGEKLFKEIIYDLNNSNDFSKVDGTSIEYFKMFREELMLENETFKTWMDSNTNLCDFIING
jgi:hypothetical protein